MTKSEYAIILDFLPYGYSGSEKKTPIAQAVDFDSLMLLELVPRRGVKLLESEKVYIGSDRREKIYFVNGILRSEKLTEKAKKNLHNHFMSFDTKEVLKKIKKEAGNANGIQLVSLDESKGIALYNDLPKGQLKKMQNLLDIFIPSRSIKIRTQRGMLRQTSIKKGMYFQH